MKVLTEARRAAQRSELGQPHDPEVFRARFMLMRRIDRLSAAEAAELSALFERHPHLAAAWEMTQRFQRVYEADCCEAAMEALGEFCDAWERTKTDMGSAVSTLLRWSSEVFNLHTAGRVTSARGRGRQQQDRGARAQGLRVPASGQPPGPHPHQGSHPTGTKVSDAELAALPLTPPLSPHKWHGEWSYRIDPPPRK